MLNRRRLPVILTALSVIIVSFLTGHRLPFYDGVSAPDEPYRYVQPPSASLTTKQAPTTLKIVIPASDTKNDFYIAIGSQEVGPQVALNMTANVLQVPSAATKVTIQAIPQAPNGSTPSEGKVVGNVYHFTATSDDDSPASSTSFALNGHNTAYIDLRLPQGYADGKLIYRAQPAGSWVSLPTNKVGNDIYETYIVGFGDYALTGTKTKPQATPTVNNLWITIISGAIICIIVAILLIRYKLRQNSHYVPKKP